MKKIVCIVLMIMCVLLVSSCYRGVDPPQTAVKEGTNGTVTLYSLRDDTLCPILTDNEANRQMLGIVFESLVELNPDMEATGVLAKSWNVSEDGLIWTFNLRDNVKWHDGDKFSAEDVVYTINQIKETDGSSYYYNVKRIENMEISGDSVVMTLNDVCPNFVNLMTFPIIKKSDEAVDRASFFPCGTGAYKFSEKNQGNLYYLVRNEKWWRGKAKLEKLDVKLLPDNDTVTYSFSSGEIDIANNKLGQKNVTGKTDTRTSSCKLSVYDFIGINHNVLELKNEEVRKAMNFALKRGKIVNDIFAGNADMANVPLRDNWFVNKSESNYETNTAEAENLLLKNQWKKDNGVYSKETEDGELKLDFEIIVNEENSGRVNIAENIRLDFEAVGIAVRVTPIPFEEYESRIQSGEYELFVGSTMIPDDMDLSFLLGSGNMFSYENEIFTGILNDVKMSKNKEKLIDNYGKLKNRFLVDMPIIGICFENFNMMYSKKVSGELNSTQSNIYSGIYNLDMGK